MQYQKDFLCKPGTIRPGIFKILLLLLVLSFSEMIVSSSAEAQSCEADEDCADSIFCTDDTCQEHQCVHTPVASRCSDGKFCTGVEVCNPDLGCQAGPDQDCSDLIPCTYDYCDPYGEDKCAHILLNNRCTDDLWCTGDERCLPTDPEANSQGCVVRDIPDCADAFSCTEDSCDESNDRCENTPVASRCGDSNDCTTDACSPSTPGADPATGCMNSDVTNGEACHVSDEAMGLCLDGACISATCLTDDDCNDTFSCTTDHCDLAQHVCVNTPVHSACPSLPFCDGHSECNPAGVGHDSNGCVAIPRDCSDGVDCTGDSCDPETDTCVHTENSTLCSNGLFCDGIEICDELLGCLSGNDPCIDGMNCTVDSCDEGENVCVYLPKDSECNDGLFCTTDICAPTDLERDPITGCIHWAYACADTISCTVDTCNESQDRCDHAPSDTLCSDGSPCTSDTCTTNGCQHSPLPDGSVCDVLPMIPEVCLGSVCSPACSDDSQCDDQLDCTVDSCNMTYQACENEPLSILCSDGNPCNGSEACAPTNPSHDSYGCVPGTPPVCNDHLSCTTDSCVDPDGCVYQPNNSVCSDSNMCNGAETCSPDAPGHDPLTGCLSSGPLDCDDEVSCTADSCNAQSGCLNIPQDAACSDSVSCTDDTCDSVQGCLHAPNHAACDDHIPCTVDSCDALLGCVHTPNSTLCNDGFSCTNDECVAGSGCVFNPISSRCQDSFYCNGQETCNPSDPAHLSSGCVAGVEVVCADSFECTEDYCDEANDRCAHLALDSRCDNANACDGQETCNPNLGCMAGAPLNCNDLVDCTEDSCNSQTGLCTNTPMHSRCDNGLWCDGAEVCDLAHGCIPGSLPNCTDAFSCTSDQCDESTDSCLHLAQNALCQNGIFCDGAEICRPADPSANAHGCVAGTEPDCSDTVDCTYDFCEIFNDVCVNLPDDSVCDDDLQCNGFETCSTTLGCQQGTPHNCADAISCTVDGCVESPSGPQCTHSTNDDLCDDHVFCNGRETCDLASHGCKTNPSVVCNDTVACTDDSCSNEQRKCLYTPNVSHCANTPCRTAIACDAVAGCQFNTAPENQACEISVGVPGVCRSGFCVPPCTIDNDCNDGFACTTDVCLSGYCQNSPNPSYSCSDGTFCNGDEICDPSDPAHLATGCAPGPERDCTDEFDCTLDLCNESGGFCEHMPQNGWCDDGAYCNGNETCRPDLPGHDSEGCLSGTAIVCSDSIPCTLDLCNEESNGCSFIPTHANCSNQSYCDGEEKCAPTNPLADAQGCIDGTAPACDDTIDCTEDSCDDVLAQCLHTPKHSSCQDDFYCNGAETCNPYQGCQSGSSVDCSDSFACTDDSCDESHDACLNLPDNGKCQDSIDCTSDLCDPENGGCVHTPDDGLCEDGASCTTDWCDSDQGCQSESDDAECDDSVYCNGAETCRPNEIGSNEEGCLAGTPVNCSDDWACTVDSCVEMDRVCRHSPDHTYCQDDLFCNGSELCAPEVPGASVNGCTVGHNPCENDSDCSVDLCDEADDECRYLLDDSVCSSENPCVAPRCDSSVGCVGEALPDGTECDLVLSLSETCQDGQCVATCEDGSQCDDGVDCTTQECGEDGFCHFSPQSEICNAGRAFCDPIMICVPGSGCQEFESACDDHVACTLDTCDALAEICVNTPDDTICEEIPCAVAICLETGCVGLVLPDDSPCSNNGICLDGICQTEVDGDEEFEADAEEFDNDGDEELDDSSTEDEIDSELELVDSDLADEVDSEEIEVDQNEETDSEAGDEDEEFVNDTDQEKTELDGEPDETDHADMTEDSEISEEDMTESDGDSDVTNGSSDGCQCNQSSRSPLDVAWIFLALIAGFGIRRRLFVGRD